MNTENKKDLKNPKEPKCSTNNNKGPPCSDGYEQKANKKNEQCCYKVKKQVDKPKPSPKKTQVNVDKPKPSPKKTQVNVGKPKPQKPKPSNPNTNVENVVIINTNTTAFKHTAPSHNANPDNWALANQTQFPSWVTDTFVNYKKETNTSKEVSCDMQVERLSLFPHQRFIRDYLQYKSPYRGLLVYHGLGVGKSCSSIAAAEMLMNFKKVVVMLPASLRSNYINEIIKCGNKYYDKKKHHWVFVKNMVVSYIAPKDLKANKGVWVIDEQKSPNYESLEDEEKQSLDRQITSIIENNYTFIHYNGESEKSIKEKYIETNFFDNKVIIIDEVHNFISGVSNASKVSTALYKLLMKSKNVKLIMLSGTPVINKPNELAYTINLLKGYEFLYSLEFIETNENVLTTLLMKIPEIDTYQIQILNKTSKINFSLVPNLFKKINNKVTFNELTTLTDEDIIDKIIRTFEEKKIKFVKRVDTKYQPLPTSEDEFNKYFVDDVDRTMTNKNLFMRRILGTVSHFINNDPRLYPTMINVKEDVNMSSYQYDKYVNARKEERKLEKKQKNTGLFGNQVSVYKTYSRNICNFVFPENINRPKPKDIKDLKDNEKKEEYIKQVNAALSKLTNSNLSTDLENYSPKFNRIIENVSNSKGNVLIYSQFSTVEGIEILSRCLDLVGYGEFKILYKNGEWDIQYDITKPAYTKFKSDDSMDANRKTEYNNILLGIYNNEFDRLPDNIRQKLKGKTNLRGEVLKILFITQSGAEGISLKNVRQVHITEPYWNKNRIDQVIGRANRTCSHIALPENERNFTAYSYTMKFSDEQLNGKDSGDGKQTKTKEQKDISKFDKNLTTDESIYNTAETKNKIISEFLECMRKAAVDCSLNNPEVGCFTFPVDLVENNKSYTMDIGKDTLDVYMNNASIEVKKKAMLITVGSMNKQFIYIKDTKELFAYSLYMSTNVLKLVGHLKELENKKYSITFI
jgi:hypothetical protein